MGIPNRGSPSAKPQAAHRSAATRRKLHPSAFQPSSPRLTIRTGNLRGPPTVTLFKCTLITLGLIPLLLLSSLFLFPVPSTDCVPRQPPENQVDSRQPITQSRVRAAGMRIHISGPVRPRAHVSAVKWPNYIRLWTARGNPSPVFSGVRLDVAQQRSGC